MIVVSMLIFLFNIFVHELSFSLPQFEYPLWRAEKPNIHILAYRISLSANRREDSRWTDRFATIPIYRINQIWAEEA